MPARWRDPRLALGLLTTLNLLVAVWCVAARTRAIHLPFSFTPALVLLVPVGGAVVWWLRRSGDKPLRG